jgi:hypothetical protein
MTRTGWPGWAERGWRGWRRGRLCAALALVLAGCGEPPALEVGRVGYSEAEVAGLLPFERESLIVLTAFALAASDRRLEEVVRPFVNRDLRSILLQRAALEIGAAAAGVDDQELRAAYEEAPEVELTVRHLVVLSERWRPEEHREEAAARAAAAAARAHAGEPFEALVAEYSDEPMAAERGGLLQPGRIGSWVAEFWEAARRLEPGEVSGVVESEFGYHVIRLEAVDTIPFEEVREEVLERRVGLADAIAASSEWLEAQHRRAVVDTVSVAAWPGVESQTPLVRWPGAGVAPFRVEDLEEYVVTLPPEQTAALREGSVDEALRLVGSLSRNTLLLERARATGITVTEPQRAAISRRWLERAERWSEVLGFKAGLADRRIREEALARVRDHRQDVLLIRGELTRLSLVLRSLYPVEERSLPAPPEGR